MDVALDPLESLWPPYRGSVLLGAARESRGRVCNAGVAVTAGHVAVSLDVHPDRSTAAAAATTAATTATPTADSDDSGNERARQRGDDKPVPDAAAEAGVDGAMPSPSLRLTVLLDAVPASAPKPGTQQLARFLTKVLGRSAVGVVDGDGRGGSRIASRGRGGLLGADVPELLVVEHLDEVVCSEFVRFDHRRAADSGRRTAEDASGGRTSGRSGLAYACIEASGLLRLWEWRGTESGGWAWSYLDSCNICACREEPLGCRVLTAAIVQEPCGDDMGCEANASSSGKRRHRLVWEQEDSGEGAGLGLASTPSAGPRPPRRVWSRRMTLDLSEGGGLTGADATAGGRDSTTVGSSTARSEISLAFSACLLPTRVDALLCSRLGAWMPAGQRVYFNHFATGRLPCVTVPILLPPRERGKGWIESGAAAAAAAVAEVAADGSFGPDAGYEGAAGGTGDDGAPFPDESGLEVEGALDAGSKDPAGAEQAESFATEPGDGRGGGSASQASARRLFAVHDSTGDLMMYDRYPRPTLRVLSLPSGAGGLRVRQQCVLDPPPPAPPSPTFLPGSFAARSNVAVFCGGGLCSVYDLCTGRLVGSAVVPRCPACALRRRHRSNTTAGVAKPCTCGRRQHDGGAASEPHGGGRAVTAADAAGPVLWTSSTRGHMLGILTATQVLRVRVPTAEVCLAATLAPSLRGGTLPPPSAPSALRYLREYRRLVAGTTAAGAWPSSPLPELLRMAHQGRGGAVSDDGCESARTGAPMMELIAHTLSAEDRGFSPAAAAAGGFGLNAANGSSGRNETTVPPWLLMAVVSASQHQGPGVGGGTGVPPSFGGGDSATAATEAGLRNALERRVEESLRSLSSVRALLQDPAGSARQGAVDGTGGALRSDGADDEAGGRLAAMTAEVDPATALFEGTLREWLACRRRGKGDGELGGQRPLEGSGLGGGMRGLGLGRGEEGSRAVGDDALALAFRCEAVGDAEALEIPFLHFLLEVSGEAPPPVQEDKRSGTKTPPASSPSAYSTFLCLQLAGEDASPLFEIACRALFRLRPQELPRFVERLARFRAYANEIKREGCAEGAAGEGAGPLPPQDSGGDEEDDEKEKHEEGGEEQEQTRPSSLQSGRPGTSVSSSADARSERTSGEDTALSEEQQRQQHQNQRSPSPPPPQSSVASRRASEDDASEHGGRDSWSTTRPSSSVPSTEHSSEPPPPSPALAAPAPAANEPPPPPSGAADNLPDPVTGSPSEAREHPEERSRSRDTAPVAPAYFARALASLPPAVEDDGAADAGSRQRRARLSLLLGACRFAEACRLLRSRAWEGAGTVPGGKRGSWRDDRGGEEAWRAAMRLLNELRRAVVAVTDKGREDAAASAASAAAAAAAAASGAGTTAAAPGGDDDGDDDDAAATMAGGGAPLALQFRLAFEDALAETILADSPERMEAVMLCRPDGLTPVAVVRMVRRAAARAAAERSSVAGAAARNGGGGGGNETDARKQFVPGSTQTLKMCLLLLLEDGAGQEFPAV